MSDDHTVQSARDAAARDTLDDWLAAFLASPGSDNAELAEELVDRLRCWAGPVLLPIDQLARLAGPADHPVVRVVDEDEWRDDVADMATKIEHGWEPPPVIVLSKDGQLVVEDGNHRIEGLRQAGREDAWAVVGFDDAGERDRFVAEHLGRAR